MHINRHLFGADSTATPPMLLHIGESDGRHNGQHQHQSISRRGGVNTAPKEPRTKQSKGTHRSQHKNRKSKRLENVFWVDSSECKRKGQERQGTGKEQQQV